MRKEKVRVVVSFYNGSKFFKEQLDSIIKQDLGPEYILSISIYNDGSSKEEAEWLAKNTSKYKNVSVINKQNEGVGLTFVRGIQEAFEDKVDFLAFADQDDVFDLSKLEKQISALKSKKAGISLHYTRKWDYVNNRYIDIKSFGAAGHRQVLNINKFSQKTFNELMSEIENNSYLLDFFKIINHDILIYTWSVLLGNKIANVKEYLVDWRIHDDSITNSGKSYADIHPFETNAFNQYTKFWKLIFKNNKQIKKAVKFKNFRYAKYAARYESKTLPRFFIIGYFWLAITTKIKFLYDIVFSFPHLPNEKS